MAEQIAKALVEYSTLMTGGFAIHHRVAGAVALEARLGRCGVPRSKDAARAMALRAFPPIGHFISSTFTGGE